MRFTTITPSASTRSRASQTGVPKRLSATATASMEETIGAPMVSSVTPNPARVSACPAAVAPPWLPMQGTHERLTPGLIDEASQRTQDGDEIAHATAAGGQSHPRTRDDAFARAHGGPLIGERRRRIEVRPLRELLANAGEMGQHAHERPFV